MNREILPLNCWMRFESCSDLAWWVGGRGCVHFLISFVVVEAFDGKNMVRYVKRLFE